MKTAIEYKLDIHKQFTNDVVEQLASDYVDSLQVPRTDEEKKAIMHGFRIGALSVLNNLPNIDIKLK